MTYAGTASSCLEDAAKLTATDCKGFFFLQFVLAAIRGRRKWRRLAGMWQGWIERRGRCCRPRPRRGQCRKPHPFSLPLWGWFEPLLPSSGRQSHFRARLLPAPWGRSYYRVQLAFRVDVSGSNFRWATPLCSETGTALCTRSNLGNCVTSDHSHPSNGR